jgi:hypothetical protein
LSLLRKRIAAAINPTERGAKTSARAHERRKRRRCVRSRANNHPFLISGPIGIGDTYCAPLAANYDDDGLCD